MKKILFLLVVLILSISAVNASENISDVQTSEIGNGDVELDMVQADCILADDLNGDSEQDTSVEANSDVSIQSENMVWYYKANPVYKFKILNSNGSAQKATVKLNKAVYTVGGDENGTFSLPLKNFKAGKYSIIIEYGNISKTNSINLFSSKISGNKDISTTFGTEATYKIRLLDNAGSPVKGAKVKFTVNKKTYYRNTDSKGYAYLKLNLASGKYTIKYAAKSFSGKNTYKVKNYVKLQILKWGLTGDVTKAPLIKKHIPNNSWVKKAVAATKKGLPLLTIKGGNGKVVFMSAGVHGNELNSQVAAMKMIKYLTTHPIKGTVYIVPFVNVKAISKKLRLTNYDFNRVAHRSGTVSNKLTKLILKKNVDAYGDFHTTVSPGVPGINVVLGYTSPNKCVPLTKYIAKNAKVNKIFYYPGQKYRWTLADWVNKQGTPAVICEVISPVNHVSTKATSLSYKQMSCFLKYHSIF